MLAAVFSALLLGLVSSAHCISMCGGLFAALSLSVRGKAQRNNSLYLKYLLAYNFGRISSYVLMGLLLLVFYWSLAQISWLLWIHKTLQAIGALVLFAVGMHWLGIMPQAVNFHRLGQWLFNYLEPWGQRLLPVKTIAQAYLYGFTWGWLPCGLVYTATLYAVSQAAVIAPVWTMLAFGMGTLPSMLVVGFSTKSILRMIASAWFRVVAGALLCSLSVLSLLLLFNHNQHLH